jgi:PAS domain S-box-containing protein
MMRAVFEHADDAVFFLRVEAGPRFIYELVNNRAAATLGLAPSALIGHTADDFFAPDEARRIHAINLTCLESRAPVTVERELALPSGARIYRLKLIPLVDPDGSVPRILAFASEITHLRRQQSLLAESETLACVGGWALDCTTHELIWTPGTFRIFDKDPGAFTPTVENTIRLFTDDCRDAIDLAFRRAISSGDNFELSATARLDSGKIIHVRMIAEVTLADGRPIRLVGGIQDITAQEDASEHRLRLEAQLRRAQKMEAVGTLAGGIAHDFNNILAGIMGNTQLAALDLAEHTPPRRFLDNAYQGCLRARDLVRRILTFSRQAEQPHAIAPLRPIVEEALALLRASLPSSISIQSRFAGNDLPILADPGQLHQIILNLGTNAAHAMQRTGGTLAVELTESTPDDPCRATHPHIRPEQTVRLTVRDTGPGIPPDIIERIFDPFFTTKPTGEGSGLGLAIVHGIVENHRGTVVVENHPGHGAAFHIFFPATVHTPPPPLSRAPTTPAPGNGCGGTILVIDDEAAITQVVEPILLRLGYKALVFNNPRLALASFQIAPSRFTAVLCDLTMPDLDGISVIKTLRASQPGLPVVLMTGFLHTTNLDAIHAAGIKDILAKPFSFDTLAEKLREVVSRRSSA